MRRQKYDQGLTSSRSAARSKKLAPAKATSVIPSDTSAPARGPLAETRALLPAAPLLVPSAEARRLLSIGTTKYFELIQEKQLKTVLIGRKRYVLYRSIVEFILRLELDNE